MRLAAIDLGTNTVRLLVADLQPGGAWRVVEQDQTVTRLGEGAFATYLLGEEAMRRTGAAVGEYVRRAAASGAREIRIVATSAVREAANGPDFVERIERATALRVEVVSGQDEARLTLRGVLHGVGAGRGCNLVFDVGGGSTEFILARDGVIREAVSLRLGVVPLAERFPSPGPVSAQAYAALRGAVRDQLTRELPAAIRGAAVDRLVGTAGTVTTLAALDLRLSSYDAGRVQGHALTAEAIERLCQRLCALTLAERSALPCLERGRADLIIPGVAIVQETMAGARADRLVVSDSGLREGLMVELAESRLP